MTALKISNNAIGAYLKIVSQTGVTNNLPTSSPLWEAMLKRKKADADGRQSKFLVRSAYGAAAADSTPVNGGAFPSPQLGTITEGTIEWKDFALTIQVDLSLINKAKKDFGRYGEPLAEEIEGKTIAMARRLSAMCYNDGAGVLGTIASTAYSGGEMIVTLSGADGARGFVGWFEFGDSLVIASTAGVIRAPTSGATEAYWLVTDKDRQANTITLQGYTSADVATTATAANDVAAGDIIYSIAKHSDTNTIHPSGITPGTNDLNSISADFCGLGAWAGVEAGHKVNGITLSGALKSSKKDVGGASIDSQHFQQIMSQVMINVSQGRYKYDSAYMSFETYDKLIESREVDRRFNDVNDGRRGVKSMGYQYGDAEIVFRPDEFCPSKRIYICPKGDAMQFFGSDFEFVKPDGSQKFFLNPSSSGGYTKQVNAYMMGHGAFNIVHPSAIGVLHNFV